MIELKQYSKSSFIETITGWGDSLTAGTGGTSYLTQLEQLVTPRMTINYGIGGQKSEQIASRQGGLPIRMSIQGGVLNGVNEVTITSISNQFLSTPATGSDAKMTGLLNGIHVSVKRATTGSSPNFVEIYTVRPVFSSTASIPDNSIFVPDNALNAVNDIQIIWAGRNNLPNVSQVLDYIEACLSYVSQPRRCLIIGILTGGNETANTANAIAAKSVNDALIDRYERNYISPLPPSAQEALLSGYSLSSQDLSDLSTNPLAFPQSMRVDNIHLNTLGYSFFATRVASKIREFGW